MIESNPFDAFFSIYQHVLVTLIVNGGNGIAVQLCHTWSKEDDTDPWGFIGLIS